MQRTDAAVAGIGAVIVALALVAAALGGPASASFVVTFHPEERVVGEGTRPHTGENVRDQFAFALRERNASSLVVTVRVSFLAGPGAAASMSARLTAPDGTAYEATGTTQPPAVGGAQAVATATFDVPLAAAPENRTVEAADASEAIARAGVEGDAPWVGEWTLDVAAQAGPAPFAQATTSWEARVVAWHARAVAEADAAK